MSTIGFAGVIPAALSPFEPDGSLHRADLELHLRYLFGTDGVTAVTVNGHAGEVASLTLDEQVEIVRLACAVAPAEKSVVAGVYAHSNTEAAAIARAATAAGADALLVFPPEVWEFGVEQDSRLALSYYEAIASASDLPLIAFVYPTNSPLHLSTETVAELCRVVPAIRAVKEWSNDARVYLATLERLRSEHPDVALLSSHSRTLLSSLAMGSDGILSGHASLVPELQVALFRAVEASDLPCARELASDLLRLTDVFYEPPISDDFTRMKYASQQLGRMEAIGTRGPLPALTAQARQRVDEVVPLLRKHQRGHALVDQAAQ